MAAELAVAQPAPVSVDIDTLKYLGYDPDNVATRALVALAVRYQLDPLLGEIQLIADSKGRRLYITRDGMLAVAHRSGQLDGITVDQQRRNSTDNGWTAYVSVWRKDMSHPFTYGAQCKDSEPQAKAGNGLEMALARAERRALRRAFQIRTDFYPDHPEDDIDVDYVEAPAAVEIVGGGPELMQERQPAPAASAPSAPAPTDHPQPAGEALRGHQESPSDGEHEHIVASKKQLDEIRFLLGGKGKSLDAVRAIVDHELRTLGELSRLEAATVIKQLASTDEEEPY